MKNFGKESLILSVLMVIALFGMISAAAAAGTGPIVAMSGYVISPSVVKPGITGSISVTFTNNGDSTASAMLVLYGKLGDSAWSGGSNNVGDIAAGTNATIIIPFSVPDTYKSGVYSLPLLISYSSSKSANLVIPILVSDAPNILVVTQNLSKPTVKPGEEFDVSLLINNSGGDARDLTITVPQNSTFQMNRVSGYQIPLLQGNSSLVVVLEMASGSSMPTGKYNAPLNLAYTDMLGNSISDSVNVGPINVVDLSTMFGVDVEEIGTAEVGSIAELNVTLFNYGSEDEKGVFVDPGSSSYLVPIGSSSTYFDVIPAKGQSSQVISIGINPSTSPGYYLIPLKIKMSDGQSFNTSLGIQVQTASMISIASETNPTVLSPGATADLTLKISNTGDSGIRSASISVSSDDIVITGQTESFIGTLNIDETNSFITSVRVPFNASTGSKSLTAKVSFKDSNNLEHEIEKVIPVRIFSMQEAGNYTNISQSSLRQRATTNGLFGLGVLPYIVAAIIAIIIIYLVYRWWTGKGKKQ